MMIASENLLLIGAEDTDGDALKQSLEQLGYRVAAAKDGYDALGLITTQMFDMLLLRPDLPHNSGMYLLEQVKQISALDHLPVVVVATADNLEQIEQHIAAGAEDYLLQPVSPVLLQARLNMWFGAKRQARKQKISMEHPEDLKYYERDLQIGRQIQASFLPTILPQPDGWEIAARFQPARQVAGDFYDAFMLTQNRRIGFVVGDVCDKGVGAALYMALFRSLIRAFAQQHHSMSWADVLDSGLTGKTRRGAKDQRQALTMIGANALRNAVLMTNSYMVETHRQARMYATLFFGVLDPTTGTLIYVNGGHNPPALIGPSGIKMFLETTGPVVGIFPDVDFGIEQVQVEPGDVLFCYTDGVPDARDIHGAFFTEERLLDLITQPAPSAASILERVQSSITAHIGPAPQFDDITMLAVRRKTETEPRSEPPPDAETKRSLRRNPLAVL